MVEPGTQDPLKHCVQCCNVMLRGIAQDFFWTDMTQQVFTLGFKTFALGTALMLAACGGKGNDNQTDNNVDEVASANSALPKPQTMGGSITGMPDHPGPVQSAPAIAPLQAAVSTASDANDTAPLPDTLGNESVDASAATSATTETPGATEPSAQDAAAIIRDYYAAIDQHNYAHAWALWSDGGHASAQTPQQFADGYADTADVTAQVAAPGRVDAAAGSRYIEIPVTITALRRDGSEHQYTGVYTLRRAVVDGANAEQRAWRIASASLREVTQ